MSITGDLISNRLGREALRRCCCNRPGWAQGGGNTRGERKPVVVVSGVKRDLSGCSRVTVEKAIKPEQWRVGRHRSKAALFRVSRLTVKAMRGPEGFPAWQ